MKKYETSSSEETKKFGSEIAHALVINKGKNPPLLPLGKREKQKALVISLRGDLGAGKTTFTQGFFQGLGIKRNPISPTFVIMRHYRIPVSRRSFITHRFKDIYHFDAYRLRKTEDLAILGFDDILANPQNIILVEWPEKIARVLPKNILKIEFEYGKKENERKITIKE